MKICDRKNGFHTKTKFVLCAALLFISGALYAGGSGSDGSNEKQLEGMDPIVLVHGMGGYGERDGFRLIPGANFSQAGDFLRSTGADVFIPNLHTLNGSEMRAQLLKEKILLWQAAEGIEGKVHLLGHSLGGLDARYLTANLNSADMVHSVTTLNSPNHGSPLSDIVLALLPQWLYNLVDPVADFVVQVLYGAGQDADALAAARQMSIEGMVEFNTQTPPKPGVPYYSYGSYIQKPNLLQHTVMIPTYYAVNVLSDFRGIDPTNDGTTPYWSQQYGQWMGGPDIPAHVDGLDHLSIISADHLFDLEKFFLEMALNAKEAQ